MTETEAKMVRDVGAVILILGVSGTAALLWMSREPNVTVEFGFDPNETFPSSVSAVLAANAAGCQLSSALLGEIDAQAASGSPMRRRDLEAACDNEGGPDNYQYYAGLTEEGLPTGLFVDQMFGPDGKTIGLHTHELQPSTQNCGGFGKVCMFNKWERFDSRGSATMGGTVYRETNRGHGPSLNRRYSASFRSGK